MYICLSTRDVAVFHITRDVRSVMMRVSRLVAHTCVSEASIRHAGLRLKGLPISAASLQRGWQILRLAPCTAMPPTNCLPCSSGTASIQPTSSHWPSSWRLSVQTARGWRPAHVSRCGRSCIFRSPNCGNARVVGTISPARVGVRILLDLMPLPRPLSPRLDPFSLDRSSTLCSLTNPCFLPPAISCVTAPLSSTQARHSCCSLFPSSSCPTLRLFCGQHGSRRRHHARLQFWYAIPAVPRQSTPTEVQPNHHACWSTQSWHYRVCS